MELYQQRPGDPFRVKQYPLSLEGRRGLKPVIDELIKKGTLEPCMPRHNTPILAVRKTDGSFRLVQDQSYNSQSPRSSTWGIGSQRGK